jgi:hypothetical protein
LLTSTARLAPSGHASSRCLGPLRRGGSLGAAAATTAVAPSAQRRCGLALRGAAGAGQGHFGPRRIAEARDATFCASGGRGAAGRRSAPGRCRAAEPRARRECAGVE